jgi:tuberous sclerosis protein 2
MSVLAWCFSFVFLQLYHTAYFGSTSEKPLLVPQSLAIERAVKNLDRIPPYETHKVGVIYVGPGQARNEAEILRNQFGSLRYAEFLQVGLSNFLVNLIQKYTDNKLLILQRGVKKVQ